LDLCPEMNQERGILDLGNEFKLDLEMDLNHETIGGESKATVASSK
jgi:hypothetical protein